MTIGKRLFDITVSALLILLLSPLLVTLAFLVFVFIGSPVLFVQERPGLNGRIFRIYKFRTMTNGRDSSGNLLPDEQRLTRMGNLFRSLSLDELPELFNVLKGDMSLVGPRPLLVDYLPLYSEWQARRHEVRPGITGWAQVNGRNSLSWNDKFRFDIWYVNNRSIWLDIKILWLTVKKVFQREGISQEGEATVECFRGNGEE